MRWQGRLWIWGLVLALAAGFGFAIWRAPDAREPPAANRPAAAAARMAAPKQAANENEPAPHVLAHPTPAVIPPGISADQWAALRSEFADRPAELQRLADHFTFADRLDRFRSGRSGGRSADQIELARALDAGLDERLREREVSAAEARLIKIAVLEVLLDGEDQRRDALDRWEASLGPPAADPQRSAAVADFQRRQATIVAAWRALPPERRDPRALESELQALRESSFDPPQSQTEGAQR